MIAGYEIDAALEQRLLGSGRTVTELEADFQSDFLPASRLVHDLPDGKMRMRSIKSTNL